MCPKGLNEHDEVDLAQLLDASVYRSLETIKL